MKKIDVLDCLIVVKRSGQRCDFQGEKIAIAIKKAFDSMNNDYQSTDINLVYTLVLKRIRDDYQDRKTIKIEDIQDIILDVLKTKEYNDVFEHYRKYREQRAISRESFTTKEQHKFLKAMEKLGLNDSDDPKLVGSTMPPYAMFYNFGRVISEEFSRSFLLDHKIVRNLDSGLLYMHGLSNYPMGNPSSVQLLYSKYVSKEERKSIFDTLIKLSRMIRKISEEQYGNVMIPYFEKELAPSLIQHFIIIWKNTLNLKLSSLGLEGILAIRELHEKIDDVSTISINLEDYRFFYQDSKQIKELFLNSYRESLETLQNNLKKALRWFLEEIDFSYQKNLKNQHVSLSFGTEETMEAMMIDKALIEELITFKPTNVLGIFKLKKEFHFDKSSLLYEIRKKAEEAYFASVLDFEFLSVSYNQSDEDVCYGFLGERAFLDNTTQEAVLVGGKGSLSFTSINLPRIALRHQNDNDLDDFYQELKETLEIVKNEILERFEYQCSRHSYNFPCLINEGVWRFGEVVKEGDRLRKIFKHGVLQVNFVGLWETIWLLLKMRENEIKAQKEAERLVRFLRETLDRFSEENNLNFTLCALELENVGTHFWEVDEAIYGKINGLSNIKKYNNAFGVTKKMSLEDRISLEGIFHKYCNGGHAFILDEKPKKDFEQILELMMKCEIGYTHYIN